MAVLVTLLAVVVAIVVVLVAGLLRSHAEILRSLHELGVGLDPDGSDAIAGRARPGRSVPRPRAESRSASDISGVSPSGDAVHVAVTGVQHSTLLAFLTSGCSTCLEFWNALARPDGVRAPGGARVVAVTKGVDGESPGRLTRFESAAVPIVMSSDAWGAFDVPVAPYFAYVDGPTGTVVGEGAATTWEQLVDMLTQALSEADIPVRGARREPRAGGAAREARADRALFDAGIAPGHQSLYPADADSLHSQDPGR